MYKGFCDFKDLDQLLFIYFYTYHRFFCKILVNNSIISRHHTLDKTYLDQVKNLPGDGGWFIILQK